MGLTQKILLFTSLLIVALVGASLGYSTVQANRLAMAEIGEGLGQTRSVWETFQADRYNKLKLGVRVLANDPYFKAAVETGDEATVLDTLRERGKDMNAGFVMAVDADGAVVARTDRPGGRGEDLSGASVVSGPLGGEESATIWRQGDKLFHAVAVPMQTGPEIKGVLVAGYGIDAALAADIRKLTHSEIAFLVYPSGKPAGLSVSTLGGREDALRAAMGRPEMAAGGPSGEAFELALGGEPFVGTRVPLQASGEVPGAMVALRSLDEEMASFRRFRNSLVAVSLVVMVVGLGLAYVGSRRITDPARQLVALVEKARSGQYTGAVNVDSRDEIGTLARTFNHLMADLREKEQMIDFLREGMTLMKRGAGVTGEAAPVAGPVDATDYASAATTALDAVTVKTPAFQGGSTFAGRYDILSTLGKGGMGVVYRALDRQLDEEVALKLLRKDVLSTDPTLLDRFKQEIKLARRITHRNVLRTHDFGETDGTPYISMEYLEGVTLKDLVSSKGALPLGVGLRVAKQMCQGLEAAHLQGVVHRDIKPQNMLILPESGELKIMDFGIARVSEVKGGGGLTTDGTVMGTPDYMPPEQAQGHPADFRSDIYSLGVVLFEVFTGCLPFSGDSVMAVVLAHIQKAPPLPRSINKQVPHELGAIILRCLEKDPARRYQSVGEILAALSEVSSVVEPAAQPAA